MGGHTSMGRFTIIDHLQVWVLTLTSWLCLVTGRAAERTEGPWEKLSLGKRTQKFVITHSRRGQSINGIVSACLKYLSTLAMKVLLIILPKRSLIESRQCNGKQKKKKQCEAAAHKGKNKKASWGPFSRNFKVWGSPGKYPLFPSSRWPGYWTA